MLDEVDVIIFIGNNNDIATLNSVSPCVSFELFDPREDEIA